MNAVVKHDQLPQVASESAAIFAMIERAATNPAVDVEKMQRLYEMAQTERRAQAEREYNSAMTRAQGNMRRIEADSNNPQTKSRYASYGALDRALRPIYSAEGFALSFDTGEAPQPETVRVLCYVSHAAGHTRTHHIDMPADGKGAKGGDVMTKTHAAGSATTYGMRYLLKMIFNVAVGEDDDDGNDAGVGAVVAEWIQSFNGADTVEALEKRGRELAASNVSGADRKRLKDAYAARLHQLKPRAA